MGIRALLSNGKEIEIPSYSLDYAIANKRITAFLRADGWVDVAEQKVRKPHHAKFCLMGNGDRDTDRLYVRTRG